MFPGVAGAADAEILKFDFWRDRGGRNWQVDESKARQRRFYQLGQKIFRANFYQTRGLGDNFRFAGLGANGKDPSSAIQATLIQDVTVAEIFSCQDEGDLHAVRWHDQFKMSADVLIERAETLLEIVVIVSR